MLEQVLFFGIFGGFCYLVGRNMNGSRYRDGYRDAIRDCTKLFEGMEKMTDHWQELAEAAKIILGGKQ